MAMLMNGVPIGMALILQPLKLILQALHQVRAALVVAEPGTPVPRFAVQPIATDPTLTTTSTFPGFVCLSPPSSFLVES